MNELIQALKEIRNAIVELTEATRMQGWQGPCRCMGRLGGPEYWPEPPLPPFVTSGGEVKR